MNIKITLSASYVSDVLLDIQNTNFRAVMHYFIPLQSGEAIVSTILIFFKKIILRCFELDLTVVNFFKFYDNKVD